MIWIMPALCLLGLALTFYDERPRGLGWPYEGDWDTKTN